MYLPSLHSFVAFVAVCTSRALWSLPAGGPWMSRRALFTLGEGGRTVHKLDSAVLSLSLSLSLSVHLFSTRALVSTLAIVSDCSFVSLGSLRPRHSRLTGRTLRQWGRSHTVTG